MSLPGLSHGPKPIVRPGTYCVSLEGLHRVVAAEPADVNAPVCATGGKGRAVLPVHIENGGCGWEQREDLWILCTNGKYHGTCILTHM